MPTRLTLLLIAACLSACGTRLTLISPAIPEPLRQRCPAKVADPLTTADEHDNARALVQATQSARLCGARMDALVDAVEVREQILQQLRQQIEP